MTEKASADLGEICRIIAETVEVERIYLFGSFAYGTPHKDSDYDLCVIIPDGGLRPIDASKKLYWELRDHQKTPLDVLVYREGRFRQRMGEAGMERQIEREGVLLYEGRKAAGKVA